MLDEGLIQRRQKDISPHIVFFNRQYKETVILTGITSDQSSIEVPTCLVGIEHLAQK